MEEKKKDRFQKRNMCVCVRERVGKRQIILKRSYAANLYTLDRSKSDCISNGIISKDVIYRVAIYFLQTFFNVLYFFLDYNYLSDGKKIRLD